MRKPRPDERTPGDADHAYAASLRELCATLETPYPSPWTYLSHLRSVLTAIRDRFRALPARYERGRLLIGIQGEIFCRLEEFSNDHLIRRLEMCGAEAWQSDVSEWVWYCNVDQEMTLRHAGGGCSVTMLGAKVRDHMQRRDEAGLRAPFAEDFRGCEDAEDVREVLRAGNPYLPQRGAGGEMGRSAGKGELPCPQRLPHRVRV